MYQFGKGISLTYGPPAHVEGRSEDVYHSQSRDACGRRAIVLRNFGAEPNVLFVLLKQ